jgi:hypothetical protein
MQNDVACDWSDSCSDLEWYSEHSEREREDSLLTGRQVGGGGMEFEWEEEERAPLPQAAGGRVAAATPSREASSTLDADIAASHIYNAILEAEEGLGDDVPDENMSPKTVVMPRDDDVGASTGSLNAVKVPDGDGMNPEAEYSKDGDLGDILIDDRSYHAPDLQRWIFQHLNQYRSGCRDLEVFASNLTYSQNAERKLATSNAIELQRKAYIVDSLVTSPNSKPRPSDSPEPSVFNTPGILTAIKLLPFPSGDEDSRLGCFGCDWKKPRRKVGADEADDTNPKRIKVWGFYLLTGDVLEKVKNLNNADIKLRERRKLSSTVDLNKSELGAALYIVLPADYEPVTQRRALRTLLSKGLVARLQHRIAAEQCAEQCLAGSDALSSELSCELQTMLQKLHDNLWADWAWEEDFVRPSLAVFTAFAYKHKRMPGVQSAAAVARGEFDAPQHFKTMLMYQEFFLQYLAEHASQIAALQGEICLRQELDARFLARPPQARAAAVLQERILEQKERLDAEIRGVLLLRDYQREAVDLCLAANHIINLPTGTGKTLIAVKLVDYFVHRYACARMYIHACTRIVCTRKMDDEYAN